MIIPFDSIHHLLIPLFASNPQTLRCRKEPPEIDALPPPLKQENKPRKTRLNPPLSLAALPLEPHEILLGAPLLNPPFLSVKKHQHTLQTKSMAATLAFLQIPTTLSSKSSHSHSSQCIIPSSSSPSIKTRISDHPTIALHHHLKSASLPLSTLALSFILNPQDAYAAGGEFGILEGRSLALIHPIVMGGLFAYTLYAGYLGWQWRRVRTLQDEINDLKKQVKPVAVTPEGTPVESTTPSPVQAKIQQLSEERKELIKGQYREKHFNAGSILLAFGVFESIGGGVNTYLRTGKLFPGPHLFGGAAITVLWAAAAALVPPMQKGSETARNLHIALNVLNVLLFVSQIPTGWDIVLKVFEFTKWP